MAEVKIIRPGYFKWIGIDKFKAVCNVTFVKSGELNILVDCGGVDESEEVEKALTAEGLRIEDIDILVLTHHHSDHAGGMALFKNALIIDWASKFQNGKYEIWKERSLSLGAGVEVVKTPGHTEDSVSLLTETVEGKIAVAGDLWWSGSDEKLLFVSDAEQLKACRETIIKKADLIIPGHDKMFVSAGRR